MPDVSYTADGLPYYDAPVEGDPFSTPVNPMHALSQTAPAQAVAQGIAGLGHSLGELVAAPGAALAGRYARQPEVAGQWSDRDEITQQLNTELMGQHATELAGLLGTGAPISAQTGAAGVFGGRLARTADLNALKRAENMEAKGAGVQEIYNTTGWYKGTGGQWRFEIPDEGLKVEWGQGRGVVGPDSRIQHEALDAAYPQFREMLHSVDKGTSGGVYMPRKPIPASWGPSIPAQLESATPNLEIARSIVAHELQHGIQAKERFPYGGSTQMMKDIMPGNVAEKDINSVAREAYQRLAGEVEARNVQNRLELSPDVKKLVSPSLTEEYKADQQLIRHTNSEYVPKNPDYVPGSVDKLKRLGYKMIGVEYDPFK